MRIPIAFLLCIGLRLPVAAQTTHYIATKQEVVDFDTAMVIELSAYRKELMEGQRKEALLDSLQAKLAAALNRPDTAALTAPVPQPPPAPLVQEQKRRIRWYLNPLLYLGAGLLMGVYIID